MLFLGVCPSSYAITAAMTDENPNHIEETIAHQEQQINDLSDMIIAQGRDIEALQKKVQKLEGKIEEAAEGGQIADQKPPHY